MRTHVVCLPVPVHSHIGAMLKLAKILHHRSGFFITFVNTDFNHRRMLKSGGLAEDDATPGFRFLSISDGLPDSDPDATQSLRALCDSFRTYMVQPFLDLMVKMNEGVSADVPPVTHIVLDSLMNWVATPAAEKFGVPLVHLFPAPACAVMAMKHYGMFVERCLKPSKDESGNSSGCSSDGTIDWLPGMKNMRPRDMPNYFGARDGDDVIISFIVDIFGRTGNADATIVNTFDELEPAVLEALSSIIPNVYAIGPFHLLLEQISQAESVPKQVSGNLWEEQVECLKWLDSKEPGSVLYVNFGSIAFLTHEQLVEFAMGLANSQHPFLWVLRSDLINGETAILPPGFSEETKNRGFLSGWCPQEKVLNHASVGGFLTHCGWNSIVESLTAGVPMICWPSFGDQQPNARYTCEEWKVGLEVGSDVRRDSIEKVVRELLGGEKGKELKRRAIEWKRLSAEAVSPTGSSTKNLEKLLARVFA